MTDPIERVRLAAAASTAADHELGLACLAAQKAGVSVTQIAEVAGKSRPTVYVLIGKAQGLEYPRATPPTSTWARVLDEAMIDLLARVGTATTEQLQAGISSRDLTVKARRFQLGMKNARGPVPEVGSLEWARISDAQEVCREIAKHGPTGASMIEMPSPAPRG